MHSTRQNENMNLKQIMEVLNFQNEPNVSEYHLATNETLFLNRRMKMSKGQGLQEEILRTTHHSFT